MKQFIGVDRNGTFIEAKINDLGIISGFNGFDYIAKSMSYDENEYLSCCQSTHEATIIGLRGKTITLHSGDALPDKMPMVSKSDRGIYERAYKADGFFCNSCGIFHDTEQYGETSFVIVDNEVFCRECVSFSDVVLEIKDADAFFKAPDVSNMNVPEEYKKLDTLFCDSSGFGREGEAALTKKQALDKVRKLLETNPKVYAGITGIGQFQVYVTLWTK